jgi:arylsulfatase A-like enzyme
MKAIVLQMNGLHCNWLGAYGNEWVETYQFDRLASESVVFDQHFSELPHPERAWRGLFSGRYCFQDSPSKADQLPAQFGSVRTILIHDSENAPYPIDDWEIVLPATPEEDETPVQAFIATLEAGLDFLTEVPDGLLWIETNLLMPPWSVDLERFRKFAVLPEEEADDEAGELVEEKSEEETEPEPEPEEPGPTHTLLDPEVGPFETENQEERDLLHGSFAAVVNELDDLLETLQEMFIERGLDREAIWIITSNCGQPLGEHGIVGLHRPWLHEELVHLPLIVRFPNALHGGRRIAELTQPIDLLPTLLKQFGLSIPDSIQGQDLLPLIDGSRPEVREYAVTQLHLGDAREEAIRTTDRYLIVPRCGEIDDAPRPRMLFAKPEDKWEVNNLQQHHLDWVDATEKTLEEFLKRCTTREKFEPPALSE